MQHVEQRHLRIGIQRLHMDDVFVTLVLNDPLLRPHRKGATSQ